MITRQIGKTEELAIKFVATNPAPELVEQVRADLVSTRDDNAAAVRVLDKFSRERAVGPSHFGVGGNVKRGQE